MSITCLLVLITFIPPPPALPLFSFHPHVPPIQLTRPGARLIAAARMRGLPSLVRLAIISFFSLHFLYHSLVPPPYHHFGCRFILISVLCSVLNDVPRRPKEWIDLDVLEAWRDMVQQIREPRLVFAASNKNEKFIPR